jgi:hydroxypyruvate isomerase
MHRRTFLSAVASTTALSALPLATKAAGTGRLKQGVTRGVFGRDMAFEDCCKLAASIGIQGFDFANKPEQWPIVKRHGMTVSMLRILYQGYDDFRHPGPPGWEAIGLKQAQGEYLAAIHRGIDTAAAQGFPNVLVLAGTRAHVSYSEGADNAVAFLNQVKSHAEDKGVTVCMELLNSRGIQAPPMSLFDHMAWGVDVAKRVSSPRVKILYDIFQAQISEGDIVQTLRHNIAYIGHVHTGSVPAVSGARHELFRSDELNYRFIAQALADLNYRGFVSHEWTPSPGSDAVEDLKGSVELMTV